MPVSALPTLRVEGELGSALGAEALRRLDGAGLARFLAGRRWFGAKGRDPRDVRVAEVVPLAWDGGPAAVATLVVELADGRAERYQLPLAVAPDEGGGGPHAVLARIEAPGARGLLYDAVEDAGFRERLARAVAAGATFCGEGARWVAEPAGEAGRELGSDTVARESRVGSAEQSNTSILYDQTAILKLYRKLEVGENPDVEIARFLTRRAFAHTPQLLGTIHLEANGERAVAGIAQRLVPGAVDAWHYALEQGRPYFAAPADKPAANPFVADAEQLGRVTRAMHEALASDPADPDFAPVPARPEDVAGWAASARRAVDDALDLLEHRLAAGTLPARWRDEAAGVAERREAYLRQADARAAAVSEHGGCLIRHHGDYHLGQVLRSRDGEFVVIDFEGEPARPLAERRERRSALRDVAGMLRSFAYVASALALEQRGELDDKLLEVRAARWERAARDAFLLGYLGAPDARLPEFLPDSRDSAEKVVSIFEMEKVFYELAYELNNRPDWLGIPLRGIARLMPV